MGSLPVTCPKPEILVWGVPWGNRELNWVGLGQACRYSVANTCGADFWESFLSCFEDEYLDLTFGSNPHYS